MPADSSTRRPSNEADKERDDGWTTQGRKNNNNYNSKYGSYHEGNGTGKGRGKYKDRRNSDHGNGHSFFTNGFTIVYMTIRRTNSPNRKIKFEN